MRAVGGDIPASIAAHLPRERFNRRPTDDVDASRGKPYDAMPYWRRRTEVWLETAIDRDRMQQEMRR
jgi:hypothetical protein